MCFFLQVLSVQCVKPYSNNFNSLDYNYESQSLRILYKSLKCKEQFQVQTNMKIKWLRDLKILKVLLTDFFGDGGKWTSLSGCSKAYQNDKIVFTWDANNRSLSFQGIQGMYLTDLILKLTDEGFWVSSSKNCHGM